MANTISNQDDVIDSRDVIARIEELQDVRNALQEEFDDNPENEGVDFDNWVCNQIGFTREDQTELDQLLALQSEAEASPDWMYGECLIREDHFTDYIEQLIDDCYELPKEFKSGEWPWRHMAIDFEAAANEAKADYIEADFDGVTYLIRA